MAHATSFSACKMIGLGTFAIGMAAMGCSVDATGGDFDPTEEQLAEAVQGQGGDPGLPNHLRPLCYWDWAFQQTARDLALGPIMDVSGNFAPMPDLRSNLDPKFVECRMDVLEVLVSCALDESDQITDTQDAAGGVKTYQGQAGIAPDWKTRALLPAEQQWVTGCMLERLNKFGAQVMILLEGNATRILPNPAHQQLYPVPESSMWGNMFSGGNTIDAGAPLEQQLFPAFEAFSCSEQGVFTCGMNAIEYAVNRVCDDNTDNCDVQYKGDCATACLIPGTSGCTGFSERVRSRLEDDPDACRGWMAY